MCKQEEIDALTKFTESLPHDSYLRPWLEDVIPQVRSDIRNDFPVSPSLTIARHECRQLIESTNLQAHAILAQATKERNELDRKASTDRDRWRARLADELHACLKQIGYGN